MKELIVFVLGVGGLVLSIGLVIHAGGNGHYVSAGFWIICAIFSARMANEALDVPDSGGNIML